MNKPKQFTIQLGALLTLYASITSLLVLLFNIININFPDAAEAYYVSESARGAIRVSMGFLFVMFPTYLLLTRLSNQDRRKNSGGEYYVFTKWLVYLSLLVAGGVLLGDLITLIIYFLNGEITTRFILKVILLLFVVSIAAYYYLLDLRGYFIDHVRHSIYFGIGVTILTLATLVYGYSLIETPAEVRERRIDDRQVEALQDMQWRIEEHYRMNKALPVNISDVYSVSDVPEAPTDRAGYEYKVIDKNNYELCATFAYSSESSTMSPMMMYKEQNYNWEHEAGNWCFERVADTNNTVNTLDQTF